jgi:integrase
MVRPGEAVGTAWYEIDFENKQWNIPAKRMKKRKAHSVPLTPQALALLEYLKPISGHREFVFPADKDPRKHFSRETLGAAFRRMGLKGKQTAHGLRALASTTLNELGFDADVIEAALAHVDKNKVRAAYNRTDYLERRRRMMCWWSDHIEAASKGNYSVTGSQHLKVVQGLNNG